MNRKESQLTQRWVAVICASILLSVIATLACGTQAPPDPPETPVLDPAGEYTVNAGKKIPIRVSATRAERYEWTLHGEGQLSAPTGDAVIFTAPNEGGSIAIVKVVAHNSQGASPPASLVIRVPATSSIALSALGIPAGWMSGIGNPANFIVLRTASGSECRGDSGCIEVTYRAGGQFAGIFWWPPGCGSSGTQGAWRNVTQGSCTVDIVAAGNMSAVNRLTFWARGAEGGEVVEFKVGASDIPPQPGRSLGKVTLQPTWQQYEIGLSGLNLTAAAGLFAWVAADIDNPRGAVFYLDDIQFEGVLAD